MLEEKLDKAVRCGLAPNLWYDCGALNWVVEFRATGHRGCGTSIQDAFDMAIKQMANTVIVSRHKGLVEWLRRHGIEGRVIEHATEEDVRGKIVVGVLPFNLAALAKQVWTVDLPRLEPEQRGQDISPEEMDAAGAKLSVYVVTKKETNP